MFISILIKRIDKIFWLSILKPIWTVLLLLTMSYGLWQIVELSPAYAQTISNSAKMMSSALLNTQNLCEWRKCELEHESLRCKGTDQICDMFRNLCVQLCQSDDCCKGVYCPQESVCVPTIGRCGVPVDQKCFDMGTTWWTGRDIPPESRQTPENPSPVTFEVYNEGSIPLYFESMLHQLVRFAIYMDYCGREQKLEIPENHFCPSPCPELGPARDRDCAKPPTIIQRLPVGQKLIFTWSGTEEIGMQRICDKQEGLFCQVIRLTLPGTYTIEVCAHTEIDGGQPSSNAPNRLIMAIPTGERKCQQVEFQYPTTTPVKIRFRK